MIPVPPVDVAIYLGLWALLIVFIVVRAIPIWCDRWRRRRERKLAIRERRWCE